VPSFVIFDENKNIINKVCGGKISHEELQAQLLIPNTNTETMDNKYQLE
jgi:hypothetical protein